MDSYIAFRDGDDFVVAKAQLLISAWPNSREEKTYYFKNIIAGTYNLPIEQLSLRTFIGNLDKGLFYAAKNKLLFPINKSEGCNANYHPQADNWMNSSYRHNKLHIYGERLNMQPRFEVLDWEVKAGEVPFFNVQNLMAELSLGELRNNNAEVELYAYNCMNVELKEPHNNINGNNAAPAFLIPKGIDKTKAAIGYEVLQQGRVIRRMKVSASELKWEDLEPDQFLRGTLELSLEDGDFVRCYGTYDGRVQIQWWLSDPNTSQNPLRAIYNAFDKDQEMLGSYLEVGKKRGLDARNIESAVAWIFWMLGFKVAHFGTNAKTQEAPDLIATSDNGHFLVIECTTGQLKVDKLSLLNDRTQTLRDSLKVSGHSLLNALPVIITSKTREDVALDIEQAEKFGILVITREGIDDLIQRTFSLPNATRYYDEAEQKVTEALAKHQSKEQFSP